MTLTELPKAYRPSEVEGAIYDRWIAADVFAPDGRGSRADDGAEPFTIIQPERWLYLADPEAVLASGVVTALSLLACPSLLPATRRSRDP